MIEQSRVGAVAVIQLNHGKVNAIDVEFLNALVATIDDAEASGAGAIVLTGAGRAFSAGVDLKRAAAGGAEYAGRLVPAITRTVTAVLDAPLPVVAAVNGAAIAGGCVLTAACDRRYLAAGAAIGATELAVGVPFPLGAIEALRHACGPHADEVVLGAATYTGDDAVRLGLVDAVVEPAELMDTAIAEAARLAAVPKITFAISRRQLRGEVLNRIRTLAPAFDAETAAAWSSPAVQAAIDAQLARMAAR